MTLSIPHTRYVGIFAAFFMCELSIMVLCGSGLATRPPTRHPTAEKLQPVKSIQSRGQGKLASRANGQIRIGHAIIPFPIATKEGPPTPKPVRRQVKQSAFCLTVSQVRPPSPAPAARSFLWRQADGTVRRCDQPALVPNRIQGS